MAILVSNAGGEGFEEFVSAFRSAYEMPLDELESIMRLRNALAEKSRDEQNDEIKKR